MYFLGINLQRLQGKRMFEFEFDVLLAFVIIFLSETLPLESILHLISSRFNVAFPLNNSCGELHTLLSTSLSR